MHLPYLIEGQLITVNYIGTNIKRQGILDKISYDDEQNIKELILKYPSNDNEEIKSWKIINSDASYLIKTIMVESNEEAVIFKIKYRI